MLRDRRVRVGGGKVMMIERDEEMNGRNRLEKSQHLSTSLFPFYWEPPATHNTEESPTRTAHSLYL